MSNQSSSSRRQFLQTLTAIAGSSAAFVLSSQTAQAKPASQPEQKAMTPEPSKGYQHTQHVDTFYKTADF